MNIWFTSDLHFNHKNILHYETKTRPFLTIEEHNEVLINNWNNRVDKDDVIFVIGDFFMGKPAKIKEILSKLNGKIVLIPGNHDNKKRCKVFKECDVDVVNQKFLLLASDSYNLILCHYPLEEAERTGGAAELFNKLRASKSKKTYFLYGHVHSNAKKGMMNNTFHVGVDTNNLCPVKLEEIIGESYELF